MDQSSAEVAAELPERGVQWVKDRVEAVLTETESYVREKPAESLLCAFVAGYILNRLPFGWSLSIAYLRIKTSDFDLWRC